MVRPEYIDTSGEGKVLGGVSACLGMVGSAQFNQPFIDLATGPLGADQCMVFSYGSENPRCFLSYNNRPKGEARALAEKYVLHGFESDPIQRKIKGLSRQDGIEIVPLHALRKAMSARYWHDFYEAPGLVDKITVLASRHDLQLSLNFYRYEESGPYSSGIERHKEALWRIAGQLALMHYHSSDDQSLEDPLLTLSEREQEVCRWILNGLTTEAIAYEMDLSPNTITTFRKRAYDKLSINSKTALFALCRA
ncbi:MAG: helix-turn-helix transcriptional regulator [Sulfitobacter sp.]